MHRHREGFDQIKVAFDLGSDFSDSTTSAPRSSLSSLSFGDNNDTRSGLSFEEAFGNQGRFARRPSRFMEATFRDSTGTQDDMAMPSRRSRVYRPAFPPSSASNQSLVNVGNYNDAPANQNQTAAANNNNKPVLKGQVFSTDDSVVGNFVSPKVRPHPNDSLELTSNTASSLSGDAGGELFNNFPTTRQDLSHSLVAKLGSSAAVNHSKAVGRRRASVAVLTGSNSSVSDEGSTNNNNHRHQQRNQTSREASRSRSRTPVRKGRSHSAGAKYRRGEQQQQKQSTDHGDGKDVPAENDGHKDDNHRRVRLHEHKDKEDSRSTRRERSPAVDGGDQRTADDSSRRRNHRTDDSSRRHHRTDDSSRRHHRTDDDGSRRNQRIDDDSSRRHHRTDDGSRRNQRTRSGSGSRRSHRVEHSRKPESQSPEPSGARRHRDRVERRGGGQSGSPHDNRRRTGRDSRSPPDGSHHRRRTSHERGRHARGQHDDHHPGDHHGSHDRGHRKESGSPTEAKGRRRHRHSEIRNEKKSKSRSPKAGNRRRHSESPRASANAADTTNSNTAAPAPRRSRGSMIILDQTKAAEAAIPAANTTTSKATPNPPRRARGSMIIPGEFPVPHTEHSEDKSHHVGSHHDDNHRQHHARIKDRRLSPHDGDKNRIARRPPHRRLERKRSKSMGDVKAKSRSRLHAQDNDKMKGAAKRRSSSADIVNTRHRHKIKNRSNHSNNDDLATTNSSMERHEVAVALAAGKKVSLSPRSRRLTAHVKSKEATLLRHRRLSAPTHNSGSSIDDEKRKIHPRGRSPRRHVGEEPRSSSSSSQDAAERSTHKLTLDTGRRRSISPKKTRTLTNQHTGEHSNSSKPSKYKESLMRHTSKDDSGGRAAPKERPTLRRHSSLNQLENKSRRSLVPIRQNLSHSDLDEARSGILLERSRLDFLDEQMSLSDSDDDSESGLAQKQGLQLKSIWQYDQVSSNQIPDLPEPRFSDPQFSEPEFDVTDEELDSPALHRVTTTNLDHVDLTALSAAQVQVVLARARGEL
ncbi:expressed unknown protein [Seminavis robusta]|uniref:Uncharacterized protein n=1 Tax=Seminavis robusta TaxID=568900 RepID=A0A9N8DVM6_9STRA|nr:expressed unknown protein [Seminavis robusta]|eukprot:Sro316_g115470.1 n/a (1030) ;mRNA; f:17229-20318